MKSILKIFFHADNLLFKITIKINWYCDKVLLKNFTYISSMHIKYMLKNIFLHGFKWFYFKIVVCSVF